MLALTAPLTPQPKVAPKARLEPGFPLFVEVYRTAAAGHKLKPMPCVYTLPLLAAGSAFVFPVFSVNILFVFTIFIL